jgi:hypothetical protein
VILAWKAIAQALAVSGAVGVTAVSMFGADSATKPRPVHVAPPASHQSTTTSTTAPPAGDAAAGLEGTSGGLSDGSSGGFASTGGSDDGSASAAEVPTTVGADAGPPPTVDESGLPIALPVSGAVIVGLAVGGAAVARRRTRARGRDG